MDNVFPGKVLVIDDDNNVLHLYKRALEKAGYSVDTANEGGEGYAKLIQGGFDLVLLDIVMPYLDGIAILKKLKERQQQQQDMQSSDTYTYNGPVIILSQLDQPQLIQNAFELGAKGYLIKANINPDELPEKISEILKKSQK